MTEDEASADAVRNPGAAGTPGRTPGRLPNPMVPRRSVLKLSLLGASVASFLSLGGLALRPTMLLEPLQPLEFFSRREFSVFAAAVDAIVPESRPDADMPRQVAHGVDQFLASCEPAGVEDLKTVVMLLESALLALVTAGKLTPLSQLSRVERAEVLDAWRTHPIPLLRTAYSAIKRLALTVFYADPRTWPGIGYPGPPMLGTFDGAREPLRPFLQ